MKAIVVSGGASKIAFGMGVVSELQKTNEYSLYVGISAGAIISLFASVNKLDLLYQTILTLKLKDIFSVSPINEDGTISFWAKLRLFFGKSSLSKNLRFKEKLALLFTDTDLNLLKNNTKIVVVGATNFTRKKIDYISINEQNHNDAIEWIFLSSNVPCVGEPGKMKDCWYFDGGVADYVGIFEAIRRGATEIDVVLHTPMNPSLTKEDEKWEPTSILKIAKRTIQIMYESIEVHNLLLGQIAEEGSHIKLKFFYPAQVLTNEIYNLDEKKLKEWYIQGVNTVLNAKNPPTN